MISTGIIKSGGFDSGIENLKDLSWLDRHQPRFNPANAGKFGPVVERWNDPRPRDGDRVAIVPESDFAHHMPTDTLALLIWLHGHPGAFAREAAERFKVGLDTVQKRLGTLIELGLIERITRRDGGKVSGVVYYVAGTALAFAAHGKVASGKTISGKAALGFSATGKAEIGKAENGCATIGETPHLLKVTSTEDTLRRKVQSEHKLTSTNLPPNPTTADRHPNASPEARPVEDVKSNSIPMQMPLLDEPAPAPASSRSGYSEEFEAFWRDYPVTKGTSKAKAWKAWRTLTAAERKQAHEALPIFWQQWDTRLKARPDAICKHPQGYLNGKLFETLLEDNQKPGGVRFWWQDPASVARIKPEGWEKFIEGNCKQVWNREMLGPPPAHEGCVVPANIVEQLRLREQFDERGFRRSADYWTKLVVEHAGAMWPFTKLGPLPSHPDCRVPKDVIEKLKLRERFDDDGLMRDKFVNVPLTAPPKAVPARNQLIAFLMALPGLFGKEERDAARLRYQREIDKLEASDENLTALLLWLEDKAERLQAKSGGPNLSRVGGDTRTKPMQQLGPGALAAEYAKALADKAKKQLAADVEAMRSTLDPIDQQAQTEFIGVLQRITKGERIDAVRINVPYIEVDEQEPVADRFAPVPAYIKWHGRTHGVESARKLYRYLQCQSAMHSDCAPEDATLSDTHINLKMLPGNR